MILDEPQLRFQGLTALFEANVSERVQDTDNGIMEWKTHRDSSPVRTSRVDGQSRRTVSDVLFDSRLDGPSRRSHCFDDRSDGPSYRLDIPSSNPEKIT